MSDENKWIETKVEFKEKPRLHMRPAQKIVECAGKFQSETKAVIGGQEFNAKSIIDMLIFAAELNTSPVSEFVLKGKGDDADNAIKAIIELMGKDFEEN